MVIFQGFARERFVPAPPELSMDVQVSNIDDCVVFSVSSKLTVPSRIPNCALEVS